MLSKESFIQLVKNNISYQKIKRTFSYINFNDKSICPFCRNQMESISNNGKWFQICNCEQAIESSKRINVILKELENLNNQLLSEYEIISKNALEIYQKHYNEVIYQDLKDKLEKDAEGILAIEKLI